MKYIKLFETTTLYNNAKDTLEIPNVTLVEESNSIFYKTFDRIITAIFHITDTTNPTSLTWENGWDNIEKVIVTKPDGTTTFELTYDDLVEYDSISGSNVDPFYGYQFDTIGDYTFLYIVKPGISDCPIFEVPYITSITLPNSITNLPMNCFMTEGLLTVRCSDRLKTIGDLSIYGAHNLISLIIEATTPPVLDDLLPNNNCIVYVPALAVDTYKQDSSWSWVASKILAIPNN